LGLRETTAKGTADRNYELLLHTNPNPVKTTELRFDITKSSPKDNTRMGRRNNSSTTVATPITTSEFKTYTADIFAQHEWFPLTHIRKDLVGSNKHMVVKIVLK